jgi:hypothetical protein
MSSYNSYTIGEAEAHLNGMLEAADMCDQHLRHDVANVIRMAVTVRRASGIGPEASAKTVQVDDWAKRYIDAVRKQAGNRVASKVRVTLSCFGSLNEFLRATDEQLLETPQCGLIVLRALKRVRDEV